jgi:hypothetical protein
MLEVGLTRNLHARRELAPCALSENLTKTFDQFIEAA